MEIDRRTPFEQLPQLLLVEEAAAWSGVSKTALYEDIRRGQIRVVRFGRLVRIPREELQPKTVNA